jgi:hypothetical protein
LVDPWGLEDDEYFKKYGQFRDPSGEKLTMQQAFERVQTLFSDEISEGRVEIHREYSVRSANSFFDDYFDWIYVDGMHDFDSVRADLAAFQDKVKPDGFILGHDFSNSPRSRQLGFGVVAAVRDFVAWEEFDLVLITNEAAPTYLLARQGNKTTLPALRNALFNRRGASSIEMSGELLDQYHQTEVLHDDGRKGYLMSFGSEDASGVGRLEILDQA